MTEEFLNSPDVISIFQNVGREAVAEGMTTGVSIDSCQADCCLHCSLNVVGVNVMASLFT
jgi:hypothetical protein